MIYVDASNLHDHLLAEKPLSGIQRLTLNSLVGLMGHVGPGQVRVLLFDPSHRFYGVCSPSDFFANKGRNRPKLAPPHFTKGDQILLTEYFWNDAVTALCANRAHFGEAKVFRFIHDVIPLALPKYYPWTWVWKFRRSVRGAIVAADVMLTNSDFSLSDICRYYSHEMMAKPAMVLKLPHEFLSVEDSLARASGASTARTAPILPAPVANLAGRDFAVMVGSLEPRKNSHLAIAAWGHMATRNTSMPILVVVGAYTSPSFFWRRRLRRAIEQTPSILHLPRCDDETLRWLYQHCQFSIFLSAYEGWGLPVGESLWFGKPVLSSNTTSLPEVGESCAEYVDPSRENDVIVQLESMCNKAQINKSTLKKPTGDLLRTWDAFSKQLFAVINN